MSLLRPAANNHAQYLYVGFSARCSAYDIGKSNPVPVSGSSSKVNQFIHVPTSVDTQHFIQIHLWVLSNLANRQTDRQTPAIAFTSSVVGGKLCATLRCIGTRVYVAGRRLSFHDPLSWMVTRSTSGCRVAGSNSDGGYRPNFVMFYLVFMLYCIIVICQLLCPRPVGGGAGALSGVRRPSSVCLSVRLSVWCRVHRL